MSLEEALRLAREAAAGPGTSGLLPGGRLLLEAASDRAPVENVPAAGATGRVLAHPVIAVEDVPGFDRSTVDGYAVLAADTFGAGEGAPALLTLAGEVLMGRRAETTLAPGQAIAVPTGGMLPPGADAVVMIEHSVAAGAGLVDIIRPVAPGENVVRTGEDIAAGTEVLPTGRRLTPVDLGVLAAVGVTRVTCRPRPRVAIIPTGDEIIAASSPACPPGRVRDITSVALAAMVQRDGGEADVLDIVPDREECFAAALAGALAGYDLIMVLGGSSVGARDYTAAVIDGHGPPGLIFHGLALKPGKPTIFGLCRSPVDRGATAPPGDAQQAALPGDARQAAPPGDARQAAPPGALVPVFGLPGHPVSSLVVYEVLVRRVISLVAGETVPAWRSYPVLGPSVHARLSTAVSSDQGREEYLCVSLSRAADPARAVSGDDGDGAAVAPARADDSTRAGAPALIARPVPGKSGLITMLSRADGLARIPAGTRGLERGDLIEVIPLA